MGRTVPSYKMVLHQEWASWKPFRDALPKRDRKEFDRMLHMSKEFSPEASMAVRGMVFEGMFMSMLLVHQLELEQLRSDRSDQG